MRSSFLIIMFFLGGILLAWLGYVPEWFVGHDPTLPALWLLMALVGLSLGADRKLGVILKTLHPAVLLLPLATTVGTFAGAVAAAMIFDWHPWECLAIGAGFAYYSLSSVFIGQYLGPEPGAIALICNILRELFTLLFVPLVARYWGPCAAIACGGASTMDTTLPIITRYTGNNWVFPSIIHAMVLDFSVPFWVTLFCSLQTG